MRYGFFAASAAALFLLLDGMCFAFDWQRLHDESEKRDVDWAESAVSAEPRSLENQYVLGLVYLHMRREPEALAIFDRMIAQAPLLEAGHWGRAEVLLRRHDYEESRKILEHLIEHYPRFYPPYVSLAYIRYNQYRFADAARLVLTVIRQNKRNVDLHTYVRAHLIYAGAKGMMAYFGGPISKFVDGIVVLPSLHDAQSMLPDYPGVYYGLGTYYLLAPRLTGGDLELAAGYFEKTIAAEPSFADSYVRLAQIYKIKGARKRYDEYMSKAFKDDPLNELAADEHSQACRFVCPGVPRARKRGTDDN